MQKIIELWQSASQIEGANWIIGIGGAVIVGLVGYYVVMLLRSMATGESLDPENLLTDFQQLKLEGKLTPDEFARIRATTPASDAADAWQKHAVTPVSEDGSPGTSEAGSETEEAPPRKLTAEEVAAFRKRLAERTGHDPAVAEGKSSDPEPLE